MTMPYNGPPPSTPDYTQPRQTSPPPPPPKYQEPEERERQQPTESECYGSNLLAFLAGLFIG